MTIYIRLPKPLPVTSSPIPATSSSMAPIAPKRPPTSQARLRPETEAVAQALNTPRITLEVIGKGIGASRFALEKYRNGQRTMPTPMRAELANYLQTHAQRVLEVADALRTMPPSKPIA